MRYPCHYHCGCSFDYREEKSRHERTCSRQTLGCCQHSPTCRREVKEWLVTSPQSDSKMMVSCKHKSNGLFGAIREDNLDLVQYFLQELKDDLMNTLTDESIFGDTVITFAAALGRKDIVQVLIKAMSSLVCQSNTLAISDIVDHETSRGKMPIIEAVRGGCADVVSILLSHQANANLLSKTHKKSALDWAIVLGNDSIAKMINNHNQLEERVYSLCTAVSKHEIERIKSLLTDGGVPFQQNQDEVSQRELELKRCHVDKAEQNIGEMSLALREVEQSKAQLHSEIYERETRIEGLEKERKDIVSSRRNKVTTVTAKVRFAATTTNIAHLCKIANPPREFELISKALCTIFHIKVKKYHEKRPDVEQSSTFYWRAIKGMLQEGEREGNGRFYHRIRHYPFEIRSVKIAAEVKVKGLPGTCSDQLSSITQTGLGSALMTSVAHWLWAIFQSLPGHQLENNLVMEESTERDILERNKIDYGVLTSRSAILKRELDELKAAVTTSTAQVAQVQKRLEVSEVMRSVAGGHSILSWAAGVGNEDIVQLLLKRGAHTPIGEDCLAWCATMIQVAFRYHIKTNTLPGVISAQERNERRSYDLAVSLRIHQLSKLIRERLKSLRLPVAEALFNGHPGVATILDGNDIPLFQTMNLFPLFCHPSGMIPKQSGTSEALVEHFASNENGCELLSSILAVGQTYSHQDDPGKCALVASLKWTIGLYDDFLLQRKSKMEAKISKRRETLTLKHRNAMASKLRSALYRGDFVAIVKASEDGGISLDFEDDTSGMTPLIRAALLPDVDSPMHEWCHNSVGEPISATAYLLDRISPHRPSVDYENQSGHTALAMACIKGRLEVVKDLVDRGADVNRQSRLSKCSAYDLAVREKQVHVVEFLDQLKGRS